MYPMVFVRIITLIKINKKRIIVILTIIPDVCINLSGFFLHSLYRSIVGKCRIPTLFHTPFLNVSCFEFPCLLCWSYVLLSLSYFRGLYLTHDPFQDYDFLTLGASSHVFSFYFSYVFHSFSLFFFRGKKRNNENNYTK